MLKGFPLLFIFTAFTFAGLVGPEVKPLVARVGWIGLGISVAGFLIAEAIELLG
jgi:hypothetical protein